MDNKDHGMTDGDRRAMDDYETEVCEQIAGRIWCDKEMEKHDFDSDAARSIARLLKNSRKQSDEAKE